MSLFDKDDIIIEKAYQKALAILDFSPQTEKLLEAKLIKKNFSKQIIKRVINKLKEEGLINDLYYAKIYADSLVKNKAIGEKKLLLKLYGKGIDKNNAAGIANEIINNNGGEEEIINRFIKKNILAIKRLFDANKMEYIKQKLVNNGFSIQNVNKAVKDLPDILNSL